MKAKPLVLVLVTVALAGCGSSRTSSRPEVSGPTRNLVVYATYPNVGPTGDSGPGRIWVAALKEKRRSFLTVGDGPAVSPDGRLVAYEHGGDVLVIPTAGGKPTAVGRGLISVWAPNSRLLAFTELEHGGVADVAVVNVDTGKKLTTIRPWPEGVAFSPDSRRIAYVSHARELYVVRTTGGAPTRLTAGHRAGFGLAWGRPGIAYARHRPDGSSDIWLINGTKHAARRLAHTRDIYPAYFSASGRELLAATLTVHSQSLYAVNLSSGNVRLLTGNALFPLGLSRDGTTVLFVSGCYPAPSGEIETMPFAGGKPHVVARGPCGASWNR